jgi:hypothetical protein
MINLILTIIILVLVLYMVIIKETFVQLDPKKCNYLPWGPDLKSCVEYCKNPSKDIKQFYTNCTTEKCINLCNGCEDIDRCQWINPYVKDVNSVNTNFNQEIQLTEVTENNSIYFTTYNPNEVNIEWEDEHRSNNYMIHYVEGTQMNNNVKIIFTDLNFLKFKLDIVAQEEDNSDTETSVEEVIYNNPLLNSGSKYLFKVYGLNTDKLNTESNILTILT